VPDDAVFIDVVSSFDSIGALRSAIAGVSSPDVIATPDVGEPGATESLAAIAALIGAFPSFAKYEATMLGNAEMMGAMDAYRADNPCINWYGTGDD